MTTVAIVDDHSLFRSALSFALSDRGVEVIEPSLTTMDDVLDALASARPDVLLLDISLDGLGSGEVLIGPVTRAGTAVVVVSATQDHALIGRCLDHGAVAWVPKHSSLETLVSAVSAAACGESVMPDHERQRLIAASRQAEVRVQSERLPFQQLTQREAVVLGQLIQGYSVEQIAARDVVSAGTVRSHVRGILTKLGVRSQLKAVALASSAGWQPPGTAAPHSRHGPGHRSGVRAEPTARLGPSPGWPTP